MVTVSPVVRDTNYMYRLKRNIGGILNITSKPTIHHNKLTAAISSYTALAKVLTSNSTIMIRAIKK